MFQSRRSYITHLLLAIVAICFGWVPFFAHAETVVRTSDVISIATEQIIEEDFYGAAGTLSMSGAIKGDMHAAAGTVTFNGTVDSDVGIAAGTVQIHGKVADDVRILAGEVTLGSEINGDVFVIAGTLKILSTAKISGDVFFFGESADIEGEIGGSLMGTYSVLRVNGKVAGDMDVVVSKLTLGERADVAGSLRYKSASELVRSQNAMIGGEITKNSVEEKTDTMWRTILISFLVSLFGSLTFYLVLRSRLYTFVTKDCSPAGMRGLIGILTLVGLPIAGLLLIVTVLGVWLGLLLLAFWLLLIVLAYLLIPIVLGSFIWVLATKKNQVNTMTVLLGTLLFYVVLQIPVVGIAAAIALLCITSGGVIMSVYRYIR